MKLGLLTSGGDCPGLNAAIRAVVRTANNRFGYETVGIRNGWKGLHDGDIIPLPPKSVAGILARGGTILGTSRFNPVHDPDTVAHCLENIALHRIDGIIVIGGDGSLSAGYELSKLGAKIIGIPKTIDNDIAGTDATFGFYTAVQTVTNAIDSLHATAESHHRIMIIETMGRNSGWIAVTAGIAGGADMILIPERPFNWDRLCRQLVTRHEVKRFSIVVVAEGAIAEGEGIITTGQLDNFGRPVYGGVGYAVAREIEQRTGISTRVTALGHVQRSGTPVAEDRLLATTMGVQAVEAASAGKWGQFMALNSGHIVTVPLSEMKGKTRYVDDRTYEIAEIFFG
ncbi:MAG: 6-phosphofructokinase [bacterium]|nr:6-phosphofructokinase [bacterium]